MTASGVNVFAHVQAEMGVGEISRRLISLLTACGLDLHIVPFEASRARKSHPLLYWVSEYEPRRVAISCLNPDQLGSLVARFGLPYSTTQKHIGFWAWELEDFPRIYSPAANLLTEIWTFSNFVASSIAETVATPVRKLTVPVPVPSASTKLTREHFGLPTSRFLISTSLDFNSDVRRKNPSGAIEAYLKAFPTPGASALLVKSINGASHPEALANLRELAGNREDIHFIDGYLNHYENHALLELSDVVLSLHRSEGYGINLSDAMARRTLVVATGYSGNLEFMDESSSVLVPYELTKVTRYAGISVDSVWAEPDLDFAAHSLRELSQNKEMLDRLRTAGYSKIVEQKSLPAAVKQFKKEFMNG